MDPKDSKPLTPAQALGNDVARILHALLKVGCAVAGVAFVVILAKVLWAVLGGHF